MMVCGLIPPELLAQLLDHEDYQNRTNGVEELKNIISELDLKTVSSDLVVEFIHFLDTLLDDTNFKVLYGTLQVISLLVQKLDRNVDRYYKQIVYVAVKTLGDTRTVPRSEYMNVFRQLMRIVGPQKVLELVIVQLKHKNSRVREDIINIITAAMLTHPRKDFNIPDLCYVVAPYLADNKKRVRHAALELFAVFDYCLDTGKKQPLMKAIDRVELTGDMEGLMAAVQARRARHILPRLSADGMVEYALTIPKPGQRRRPQLCSGADLDWVLNGGRVNSAQSGHTELDSNELSGYGSLGSLTDDLPLQRRIVSAGKGKNKLPWENSGLPNTINLQPHSASDRRSYDKSSIEDLTTSLRQTQESFVTNLGELNSSRCSPLPVHTSPSSATSVSPFSQTQNVGMSSPTFPVAQHYLQDDSWQNQSGRNFYLDLSLMTLLDQDKDDREEMKNSLRSLRNSAAKKRAKVSLSGSDPDPDSPDSAVRLEPTLDSPSHTSPSMISPLSESSLSSLCSPPTPTINSTKSSPGNSKTRTARVSSAKQKTPSCIKAVSQGVQQQENAPCDVSVVGQRVVYSNGPTEEGRCRETVSPPVRPAGREPVRAFRLVKGSNINNSRTSPAGNMSEGLVGQGVFGSIDLPINSNEADWQEDSASKTLWNSPDGVYSYADFSESPKAEKSVEKLKLSRFSRDKMHQQDTQSIQNEQIEHQPRTEKTRQHLRHTVSEINSKESSPLKGKY